MKKLDRDTRRILLKPLIGRRQGAANRKALIAALDRLDSRALGEGVLADLRDVVSELRGRDGRNSPENPDAASKWVAVVKALYLSRRISTQEYVFYAASRIEGVHESRIIDGKYEELQPISAALARIRQEHGLSPDEYWARGEGPGEYIRLNEDYDAVVRRRFIAALKEFGLHDLADLREQHRTEFDRLRERGRRSIFHRNEQAAAIRDIVVRYEEEARKAAATKAYSAAVTSLGAGVEGLLLLRCLRSKHKAQRIASELPRRQRPRVPEDPGTWTFDALIAVCLGSGWQPPVSTSVAQYNAAGLANQLRLMRNHVHPGRHARERPWIETDERD